MFPAKYILRFDDINPGMAWSKFLPLKIKLEKAGILSILGVVPDCLDKSIMVEKRNPNFFDYVRKWKIYGDAIAQHGTHHVYFTLSGGGMLKIGNQSEFAGLLFDEQLSLIDKGKKILENEGCWQPFFMAPSHSFDENTLIALTSLGFESITDGYGIFPYRVGDITLVPQLFSKPVKFLPGIQTLCIHINSMNEHEITKLESFVLNNRNKFVNYIELSKSWQNFDKAVSLRYLTEFTARTLRYLKSL
jgi:hypothetical protein